MQISEIWLREFVNPAISTSELAAQLTMAGLEVDSVTPVAAEFSGVVVGEVLSVEQHPNADKLRVCRVNVGTDEPLQIVCGASNVRPGLKVPAALIGAVLPGDFKIKKSKLRGVESCGMLCSETELGLATEAQGLMELAADAQVALNIRDYLQLNDQIFEIELTPNRADCLSVEGIAREVAVLNQLDAQMVQFTQANVAHQQTLAIQISAPAACPRYLGRLINNVNPQATTPLWMQERLRRAGQRSLGILVDVTNYVLLELGQPLHAFDAAKLSGGITVRYAHEKESLALLNKQTIQLDMQTLVIADDAQALALAGIMGGDYSAVSDATTDIFLECAFFAPTEIAGKARRFGLHTDSSHRFERGVDPFLQQRAIERATQLIVETAGGEVGVINEVVCNDFIPQREPIVLRKQRLQKMLGITADAAEVENIFQRLGMNVIAQSEGWSITPPGFRFDMAIEADLIEEVARIVGYNNLPNTQPLMRSALASASETTLSLQRVQDLLVDRGYQEAVTYSFVDEEIQALIAPNETVVRLQNPISSELSVMRTTLWCGLLRAALYNTNRQQQRVRLFETGLRFVQQDGATLQQKMLAGLALGAVNVEQWSEKNRKIDFFDMKADVEALVAIAATTFRYTATKHPALHPGQSAQISTASGENSGWIGMLHPTLEKQLGFDSPVFLFEITQEALLQKTMSAFTPLSRFPSVRRDMALVVDDAVTAQQLLDCIAGCQETAIQKVTLFDVYRDPSLNPGFKSVALSLQLQNFSQTLTDPEIDAIFSNVLKTLTCTIGAKLRE